MTAPAGEAVAPAAMDLLARFSETFGARADGVWAAPGRINLIGEHLDYNGGKVLPIALPQTTLAAVRQRRDDRILLLSASVTGNGRRWEGHLHDVAPGHPRGWPGYVAGVLWALRRAGHDVPGCDIAISSTVPIGAGLSSSAAIESSVALAIADLIGLPLHDAGRAGLAAACARAENEVVGAPTGGGDQAAVLRATAGHALLLDTADDSIAHIPLDLAATGLALLIIDTRAPHRLIDGQYAARRDDCEAAAALLGVRKLAELAGSPIDDVLQRVPGLRQRRRVRHVLTEVGRVDEVVELLRTGQPGAIGPLLNGSHVSLRDDYQVSSSELDVVVDAANLAGALGARMTGGGFGGSAIALVPSGLLHDVREAVTSAAAEAGQNEPRFLDAEPSQGAHRVI